MMSLLTPISHARDDITAQLEGQGVDDWPASCGWSRRARRFPSLEFAAFASHMIQVMDGARRLFYRAPIDSNPLEKTS
jgi:hypothetical protein